MCGIAGMIGFPRADRELALRLRASLRHRGPDDEGIAEPAPSVYLVHTRLAIIDLTRAGHQPMADRREEGGGSANWVVFNGEIYNYRELARELVSLGCRFATDTDTEVILQAYRIWGPSCVERLRGMFAICLVDTERGVAHLYRDRLGIKPLYMFRPADGGLIFASELRAILALGEDVVPASIDRTAIESFLAQGAVQGYGTAVRGVELLRPATHVSVDLATGREISAKSYWQLSRQATAAGGSREAAVEQLRELAQETIRLHLISDAPLGLFLSGGVDSTALLTMACDKGRREPLRTLTVAFDCEGFDESVESSETAARFGVNHQTLPVTGKDVLNNLDRALDAMDQPTVDGFNTWLVSHAARNAGLTVALSGLGGDELFGGYDSFTRVPRITAIRRSAILSAIAGLGGRVIASRAGAKLREAIRREPDLLAMYLLRRELFFPWERRELHSLPHNCDPSSGLDRDLIAEVHTESADLDELNRMSLFELELYMRHMLLRDADAFSMSAPIEYRVPFLDHRMVETAFALPGSWKRPDPRPKPLLLDVAGDSMPAAIAKRPKRGFALPWGEWLAPGGAMCEAAREVAYDATTWRDLGMEPAGARSVWERFAAGDPSTSPLQVLALITLRHFCTRHHLSA